MAAQRAARKTASKSSAKPAAKPANKPAPTAAAKPSASSRVERGTRWTEEQVQLLLDAVKGSKTAKEGFATAAKQLGKNTGTVQQKYYSVVRAAGGGRTRKAGGRKPGRPVGSTNAARATGGSNASASNAVPSASALRGLSVDDLVSLASRVKDEVDRRRRELDAASRLFG